MFPCSKFSLGNFFTNSGTLMSRCKRRGGIMEQILSVLYGVSGVLASALYLPQIAKFHQDHEARRSISLTSWGGWIVIAIIAILYAIVVAKNYLIATVATLNVAAQAVVLCYGINARLTKNRLYGERKPNSSAIEFP